MKHLIISLSLAAGFMALSTMESSAIVCARGVYHAGCVGSSVSARCFPKKGTFQISAGEMSEFHHLAALGPLADLMTSDCDVRPPLQSSRLAEDGQFKVSLLHTATILVLMAFDGFTLSRTDRSW
jgi:hypothetical protein